MFQKKAFGALTCAFRTAYQAVPKFLSTASKALPEVDESLLPVVIEMHLNFVCGFKL